MSKQEEEPKWVQLQKKAFTKWANFYLGMRKIKIDNLYTDLADGVALINLLEVIGGSSLGYKYNKKPRMRIQKLENVSMAFKYLEKKGVRMLNTGPNDVVDGNQKIILGLMWTIIQNFQIADIKLDGVSGKAGLLLWYKRQVSDYDVKVSNFSSSFRSGLAFCALMHKYRPSAIPWDELVEGDNPLRNLTLAFEAGRAIFGVEPLSDPEDLLDSRRPDEKVICCYVSFLFQAVAQLQKQAGLVKSIHKAMEISCQHDTLIQQYLDAARESISWMEATRAEYEGEVGGDSLDGIKTAMDAFYEYRITAKPEALANLKSLETKLKSLQASQRNNSRPPYVPPADFGIATLETLWKALEETEDSYEERARQRYAQFQHLDNLLARFDAKHTKVAQWIEKQVAVFTSGCHGASVPEVEHLMDAFKAYQQQLVSFGALVDALEGWTKEEGMSVHASYDVAVERVASLRALMSDMEAKAAAYRDALAASLERQTALVTKVKAYNSDCAAFMFSIDDFTEDVTNDPIPSTSIEAVREVIAKFEASTPARLGELKQHRDRIAALAEEVAAAGNAFDNFAVHDVNNKVAVLEAALTTRREGLSEALRVEERKEELRSAFAAAAQEFVDYCQSQMDRCSGVTGELADQLTALKALQEELTADRTTSFQTAAAACAEAGIVTNSHTRENRHSLTGRWEQLRKYVKQSVQAVEGQMLAAKAGDLTVEQVQEMKEVFEAFDADKDDNLNPDEFYNCTTGIGLVLSEEEMKEAFSSIDVSGDGLIDFDEFTQFMAQQLKEPGYSQEDVQDAFNQLAGPGNEGTLTDAQITRFFSDFEADIVYLKEHMPVSEGSKAGEDERDTTLFVEKLFSR